MKKAEQGIRARRRRSQYASIPNALVRNKKLSIEARMLMVYIMGCSESWVFYASVTMDVLGLGRDRYRKALGELRKFGYLVIHPKQDPATGRMSGQEWEIIDDPEDAENDPTPPAGAQDASEQVENTPQDVDSGPEGREPEIQAPGVEKNLPSTGGLKNRQTVQPAGRDIDPLRRKTKKEEKQIRCAADAPHNDGFDFGSWFDRIWRAYPKPGNWKDTEIAALKLIDAGESPEVIEAAVKAYAKYSAGFDAQRVKLSQNFFANGWWKRHVPKAEKAATNAEIVEFWTPHILDPKPYMKVNPNVAALCIEAETVTREQCHAAGVAI